MCAERDARCMTSPLMRFPISRNATGPCRRFHKNREAAGSRYCHKQAKKAIFRALFYCTAEFEEGISTVNKYRILGDDSCIFKTFLHP
jgi:hypothetical protein